MMQRLLFNPSLRMLLPLDSARAQVFFDEFLARCHEEDAQAALSLKHDESACNFLNAVLDLSPYLREMLMRSPQPVLELLHEEPEQLLARMLHEIRAISDEDSLTETQLMSRLRIAKRQAHVTIALCDLAGYFDCVATTHWLSDLAEACLGAAIRFLLLDADRAGKIKLADRAAPEIASGLIVLGMGKLGARELNYSSDIDLIVFIDDSRPAIHDPYECVETFSRMIRRLVRIMQERTGDGYVFRTDLRLRPDPGSTPLAIPVNSALHYYEGRGQNWERAAMIKARPVAGDREAGAEFLHELSPYVWRKYLDYAAIADVHSIKRQIHAHKGHGNIAIHGHNVKLGRGGIREIEFFVQTQQLIAGGRVPSLRGARTLDMLDMLGELGWITGKACEVLQREYVFLRDVEHRIQMVADEQTHILPEDEEGFARIAHMMGYEDPQAFSERFLEALKMVEKHYAALFEMAPELGASSGNLVFTGDVDDPGTLETLSQMGFERPSDICRIIRTWHFGRYRATRSSEARERLTELTPALLKSFAESGRADEALMRFDGFLQGLPAGIQLFSLLQSNPRLLGLLTLVMGSAPHLAEIITRKPHVFDGLLDPAILTQMPTRHYLVRQLKNFLSSIRDFEAVLDGLRIFAAEQRFLIGIRLLTGAIDGVRAGRAFSDLAELMIEHVWEAVEAEFILKHGRVANGRAAVLAMGKLGSSELTASSDVDMILLYDHAEDAGESDGEKPLPPSQYFIRLTQRLIAALSAPTAEGVLYQVDMRLRPSGNKGPVATHFESFSKYQREEAWTWEHMALTRARPVAGDADLQTRISDEIETVLNMRRDKDKMVSDIAEMRALIAQEKPARDLWDIKLIRGGLIDLEFIAQFSILNNDVTMKPRPVATQDILAALEHQGQAEGLLDAHRFYTNLSQTIRLCLGEDVGVERFPQGLKELLCRVGQLPDLARVEYQLVDDEKRAHAAFDAIFSNALIAPTEQ